MRNAPPISTSSPREMMTSCPNASVLSNRTTAAALLLTTVAASAPVSSQIRASRCESLSPRLPVSKLYSRSTASPAAMAIAAIAESGSLDRPRLVWITVPVRLNTGLNRGLNSWPMRVTAASATRSATTSRERLKYSAAALAIARRRMSTSALIASFTGSRPKAAIVCCSKGCLRIVSTGGISANTR